MFFPFNFIGAKVFNSFILPIISVLNNFYINIKNIFFNIHLNNCTTLIMFSFKIVYIVALQLLYSLNYGSCLKPHKINPYAKIVKMLHQEPPINMSNNTKDYDKVRVQWLEQRVDHFDRNNTETWKMVSFKF